MPAADRLASVLEVALGTMRSGGHVPVLMVASLATASIAVSVHGGRDATPPRGVVGTPTATRSAAARRSDPLTPARLANVVPQVVYADTAVVSYQVDRDADAGIIAAADDREGTNLLSARGTGLASAAALVDACPASDDESRDAPTKTITLFFVPDTTAHAVPGTAVLWRQADDSEPTVVIPRVVRDGHRPLLQYRYASDGDDADSLAVVPTHLLPISRRDTIGGLDVRALRAVEWHFLVPVYSSPGGTRLARVHVVTALPTIGHLDRRECRLWSRTSVMEEAVQFGAPRRAHASAG